MMRIGFLLCTLFIAGIAVIIPHTVFAQTASDIQSKIGENKSQIESLEAEIAAFQKQLDVLGSQKNTLQSTIDTLTLSQKQLAAQIQLTQSKIATANLEIQKLSSSIGDKEETITANQEAIAKIMRRTAQDERMPLIASLISSHSLGAAWQLTDQAVQFNRALSDDINELRTAKSELAADRDLVSSEKDKLVILHTDLTLQKRSVDVSKQTQQQLLSQTKNQEKNYQRLIAQKEAAEKAFEQELMNLQGQLNLIVNPNLLPKVGSGVLSWPLNKLFMFNCTKRSNVFGNLFCITQYFGNTPFSTANAQVYNNHGHNAIDIGVPIGTPIQSSADGVVLGTGDTDIARGCYSFGKWVMVTHGNGLSTLYAHLSSIDVVKGQNISDGQILGLSGMTGYATGPHLHFGVYATQGTQILRLGDYRSGAKTACAGVTMPVATLTAYLNPLSYL